MVNNPGAAQEKDLKVNSADTVLPVSDRDLYRMIHGGTSPTPSAHSCLPSWCAGGSLLPLPPGVVLCVWRAGRAGWHPALVLPGRDVLPLARKHQGCVASIPWLSLC